MICLDGNMKMIKEKYKQLYLVGRFAGINTIEYTQMLAVSVKKQKYCRNYEIRRFWIQ